MEEELVLAFIHLSDIHFRNYSGDPYDVDQDLRDELLRDISNCYNKHVHRVDGILICGDIAFSGKESEYDAASNFLNNIFGLLQLDKSRVFCVPGNHDVDQSVTKTGASVKYIQNTLKSKSSVDEYDAYLGQIFRNPQDAAALYSPISCYNEKFAAQYGCSLAPDRLIWAQEIQLDADYKLRLIGINSTIVSNESDHLENGTEEPMRIGKMQIPSRENNTIYLSLCHHPPECWFDPEHKLSQKMDHRVTIQLYGHKHLQTIQKTEKGLLIGSGATHPSRLEEGWVPRYNWITLDIKNIAIRKALEVRIFPRILDKAEDKFESDKNVCDGKDYVEFLLDLPDQCTTGVNHIAGPENESPEVSKISVHSWERNFIYEFINLPFFRREAVLKKLNLSRPEDEGLKHSELLDAIVFRAKEQNSVAVLLEEMKKETERMA